MSRRPLINRSRSRGISLVVSLVLLVIITLIAVTSIRGTLLEERMSGNLYDREIAFQSAEAALRAAEAALSVAGGSQPITNTDTRVGFYPQPDPSASGFKQRWEDTETNWAAAPAASDPLSTGSQYIVEDMGVWPDPPYCDQGSVVPPTCLRRVFRITARSTPVVGRAQVMLQTSFRP